MFRTNQLNLKTCEDLNLKKGIYLEKYIYVMNRKQNNNLIYGNADSRIWLLAQYFPVVFIPIVLGGHLLLCLASGSLPLRQRMPSAWLIVEQYIWPKQLRYSLVQLLLQMAIQWCGAYGNCVTALAPQRGSDEVEFFDEAVVWDTHQQSSGRSSTFTQHFQLCPITRGVNKSGGRQGKTLTASWHFMLSLFE